MNLGAELRARPTAFETDTLTEAESASLPLLSVEELSVDFGGATRAVDGVSFTLERGEILGIAGESGSGKSVTAMALTRLLPANARTSGRVVFDGQELMNLNPRQLRAVRGAQIGMVFQDPVNSLNPVLRIGQQLMDVARAHGKRSSREARQACLQAVEEVALDPGVLERYPMELSGGMCQRVGIAMGLIGGASLLIADEPTTALDVTVQAQVLALLKRLCVTRGMSCIFISHDLAVLAQLCDQMVVMYRGQLMESGTRKEVLSNPGHPYTIGLLNCVIGDKAHGAETEFREIRAAVRADVPGGCRFYSRCDLAEDACVSGQPDLVRRGPDEHQIRCVNTAKTMNDRTGRP